MDYSMLTLQECINLHEKEGRNIVINDGNVVGVTAGECGSNRSR